LDTVDYIICTSYNIGNLLHACAAKTIWGLILAFLHAFRERSIWLEALNYIFTPLPGFFHALSYGVNDWLRTKFKQLFSKINIGRADPLEETKIDNEEFTTWRKNVDATWRNNSASEANIQ